MPYIVIARAGEAGVLAVFTLREKSYDGPVTLCLDELLLTAEAGKRFGSLSCVV